MALTAAERQRRKRERIRAGRRRVVVELDEATLETALVDRGFLSAADADDDKAVAAAAGQALAAWAEEQLALAWARDVTRDAADFSDLPKSHR